LAGTNIHRQHFQDKTWIKTRLEDKAWHDVPGADERPVMQDFNNS
jgi:hypothetical protein